MTAIHVNIIISHRKYVVVVVVVIAVVRVVAVVAVVRVAVVVVAIVVVTGLITYYLPSLFLIVFHVISWVALN